MSYSLIVSQSVSSRHDRLSTLTLTLTTLMPSGLTLAFSSLRYVIVRIGHIVRLACPSVCLFVCNIKAFYSETTGELVLRFPGQN